MVLFLGDEAAVALLEDSVSEMMFRFGSEGSYRSTVLIVRGGSCRVFFSFGNSFDLPRDEAVVSFFARAGPAIFFFLLETFFFFFK